VRLTKDEPDTIAGFLNMDVGQFIEAYTVLTCDRQALALTDKKNGECIFLCASGCRINPVKPGQCLDFPHQWKFKAFKDICAWAVGKNQDKS